MHIESPEGHKIPLNIKSLPDIPDSDWLQIWRILGCTFTPGNHIKVPVEHRGAFKELQYGVIITCTVCRDPVHWNGIGGIIPGVDALDILCRSPGCIALYGFEYLDRMEEEIETAAHGAASMVRQ